MMMKGRPNSSNARLIFPKMKCAWGDTSPCEGSVRAAAAQPAGDGHTSVVAAPFKGKGEKSTSAGGTRRGLCFLTFFSVVMTGDE